MKIRYLRDAQDYRTYRLKFHQYYPSGYPGQAKASSLLQQLYRFCTRPHAVGIASVFQYVSVQVAIDVILDCRYVLPVSIYTKVVQRDIVESGQETSRVRNR